MLVVVSLFSALIGVSQENLTKKRGLFSQETLTKKPFRRNNLSLIGAYMKRTALALTLIWALLISAAAGTQTVHFSSANFFPDTSEPTPYLPNILIKSDGTVEPETEFIRQDGDVYTLMGNLTEKYAIRIQCSNIVFDGAGHIIDGSIYDVPYYGPGNKGLSLESVTNVTVRDIEVSDFRDWDVSIENSRECVLLRVKARELHLQNSNFSRIAESNIGYNFYIQRSNNNTIARNNFSSLVNVEGYANTFFENNFGKLFDLSLLTKENFWDNGSVGNYWIGYNGTDANGDGIGDTPYVINAEAQDRYPLMNPWDPVIPYDTVPPRIVIVSPENKVYNHSDAPLTFLIYEASSSMSYSLNGQDNVTIAGNTTLSELPNGIYNVTVYVTDRSGNTGASETIHFSMDVPEPFPTVTVTAVSVASVVAVGAGLLVYSKKRKRALDGRDGNT
jgi:hypothetical protein